MCGIILEVFSAVVLRFKLILSGILFVISAMRTLWVLPQWPCGRALPLEKEAWGSNLWLCSQAIPVTSKLLLLWLPCQVLVLQSHCWVWFAGCQ